MRIRIIDHALLRAGERGASEREIQDVVKNGADVPARGGRLAREKVYPYNREWLGKRYPEKKIKVVYAEEGSASAVITVYVFYGKWSEI